MSSLLGEKMKRIFASGFLALLSLICSERVLPQESVLVAKNYVGWAQDFLQTMYPSLKNQKYTLSLVSYEEFDKDAEPTRAF